MKNISFSLCAEEDRKKKLTAHLRYKTRKELSQEQYRQLFLTLRPERQYHVFVEFDPVRFCNALIRRPNDRGTIAFGQVLFGQGEEPGRLFSETEAAAVIIYRSKDGDCRNELHIYLPSRLAKGA